MYIKTNDPTIQWIFHSTRLKEAFIILFALHIKTVSFSISQSIKLMSLIHFSGWIYCIYPTNSNVKSKNDASFRKYVVNVFCHFKSNAPELFDSKYWCVCVCLCGFSYLPIFISIDLSRCVYFWDFRLKSCALTPEHSQHTELYVSFECLQ